MLPATSPRPSFLCRVVPASSTTPSPDGCHLHGPDWTLTLHGQAPGSRLFVWDSLVLLLRGVVRFRGRKHESLDLDSVAAEIHAEYLERGQLPIDRLAGAFNLVLLDGEAERVLAYRNYAASGPLYYRSTGSGLLLASNLTDLLAVAPEAPRIERDALPTFFLHGCVPGRETLVADCFRLLPGEMLHWEQGRLVRLRLHPTPQGSSASLPIESVLGRVIADTVSVHGPTATLLSGPVSATLQAAYNDAARTELLPASFSVSLNTPTSWAETEQIMLASRGLGTEHRLIAAEGALLDELPRTMAATGEPLLASPALFLGLLAPALAQYGFRAGLAGLGGGIPEDETTTEVSPSMLRRGLYSLARWVGLGQREPSLDDAPDRDSVRACFGEAGLQEAASVTPDVLDWASATAVLFNVHGVDFLCPLLDSRMIARAHLTMPARSPWPLDWLAPGGLLRPLVEQIDCPEFLDPTHFQRLLQKPTRFLWHLLAFDRWHRQVIEQPTRYLSPTAAAMSAEPEVAGEER